MAVIVAVSLSSCCNWSA